MKKIKTGSKVILLSWMSMLIIYSCEKDQIEKEKDNLLSTQGVEYASSSQQVLVSNITPVIEKEFRKKKRQYNTPHI